MNHSEENIDRGNLEQSQSLPPTYLHPDWFKAYIKSNQKGQMVPMALNAKMGKAVLKTLFASDLDSAHQVTWTDFLNSQFSEEQLQRFSLKTTESHRKFGLPIICEGSEEYFIPKDQDQLEKLKQETEKFLAESGERNGDAGYIPAKGRLYQLKDGILIMPKEALKLIWKSQKAAIFKTALDYVDWAQSQSGTTLDNARLDDSGPDVFPQLTPENALRLQEFSSKKEFTPYKEIFLEWHKVIDRTLYLENMDIMKKHMRNFNRRKRGNGRTRGTPHLFILNNLAEISLEKENEELMKKTGIKAGKETVSLFIDNISSRRSFNWQR